jgi:hypothetical protein
MTWEPPTYVDVKMDAEINAYQDDFGDVPMSGNSQRTHLSQLCCTNGAAGS